MPNPENIVGKGFDKHPDHINKKGRPPKLNLDEILSSIKEKDVLEWIEALNKKAKKGDLPVTKELLDRIFGKVKQDIAISGGVVLHFDKDDQQA